MEINAKSRLKASEAADKAKAIVKLCNNVLFKDIKVYTDLAERYHQKAIANAKELIELVKNAASDLIQDYDFAKSYNRNSLGQCLKPLENYLEKEIFSDYRVSFYDTAIIANGGVSPEKASYEINFLAALDMNKIRNDLSRF